MSNHLFLRLLLLGALLFTQGCVPFVRRHETVDPRTRREDPVGSSRQMVLVVTPSWGSVDGVLMRYERDRVRSSWRAVGHPIPAVVGRNGMAWGDGRHQAPLGVDSGKREGDGKAPAGVFGLSRAFGLASLAEAGSVALPYTPLTLPIECVDDVASVHYNQLVDRDTVALNDRTSSERMSEQTVLYRWGVFVEHNREPVTKGEGSCIFLHVWRQAGRGTAGCTAMPDTSMERLMRWLDPSKDPVLVQLPKTERDRLRSVWHLPK